MAVFVNYISIMLMLEKRSRLVDHFFIDAILRSWIQRFWWISIRSKLQTYTNIIQYFKSVTIWMENKLDLQDALFGGYMYMYTYIDFLSTMCWMDIHKKIIRIYIFANGFVWNQILSGTFQMEFFFYLFMEKISIKM